MLLDGQAIDGPSRDRGMVFQAYTSFAWLTCGRKSNTGCACGACRGDERKKKALKMLDAVGLSEFANRFPKDLSGGMKQRVAIARTLINEPRLVLMDEPFGALDPQTRWGMQSLLLDISRAADNTILFVTHDVSEAVYLADTVYCAVAAAGAYPAPGGRAVLHHAGRIAENVARVPGRSRRQAAGPAGARQVTRSEIRSGQISVFAWQKLKSDPT